MNRGREEISEGISQVCIGADPTPRDFAALLASDPDYFLGATHVKKFGAQPQLLVKFLDSGTRLHFQAHPTREFAQRVLGAPRGKTEAYYVLGVRSDGWTATSRLRRTGYEEAGDPRGAAGSPGTARVEQLVAQAQRGLGIPVLDRDETHRRAEVVARLFGPRSDPEKSSFVAVKRGQDGAGGAGRCRTFSVVKLPCPGPFSTHPPMTAAQLRKYLPRAPLTIHLVSGRNILVPHSEFAAIGPRDKFVIVFDHKDPDDFDLIDLSAIASVGLRRRKSASAS